MKTTQIESGALNNTAWQLAALRERPCRMPPLVFFHDPARIPDVREAARQLPKHCAIVYRHFGADDREEIAQALREITIERAQILLIGADPELAETVGADGVHFRRDPALALPAKWRDRRPDWIITMAGLKDGSGYHIPLTMLDAVFVSSVFPSDSSSAGAPIGLDAFKKLCETLDTGVFALGGVTPLTAPRLIGTGAAGLAAIGGFLRKEKAMDILKEATENGFRFVIYDDLGEAELTMKAAGDGVYDANHTGVPKTMGGRGVGKKLIAAMVADAKANDYKVIPSCPFVAAMFKRKPEWGEVAA